MLFVSPRACLRRHSPAVFVTAAFFVLFGASVMVAATSANDESNTTTRTQTRIGATLPPEPAKVLAVPGELATVYMGENSNDSSFNASINAGIAAFAEPNDEVEKMRLEFEKRGKYMAERLNAIDGIKCLKPTGAFYCFPDVSAHYGRTIDGAKLENSMNFASSLLDNASVALVPGGPFGCDRNVRLSFATSMEMITKGLDRIEKWLTS